MLGVRTYRCIGIFIPRRFYLPKPIQPSPTDCTENNVGRSLDVRPRNCGDEYAFDALKSRHNDMPFYWESYHAMRSAVSNPTEEKISQFLAYYNRAEPGIKRTLASIDMMERSAQIFTRSRAAGKVSNADFDSLKLINDKIGITRGERIMNYVIIGTFGIFFVFVFAISFG